MAESRTKKDSSFSKERADIFKPRKIIGPRDVTVNLSLGKIKLETDLITDDSGVNIKKECDMASQAEHCYTEETQNLENCSINEVSDVFKVNVEQRFVTRSDILKRLEVLDGDRTRLRQQLRENSFETELLKNQLEVLGKDEEYVQEMQNCETGSDAFAEHAMEDPEPQEISIQVTNPQDSDPKLTNGCRVVICKLDFSAFQTNQNIKKETVLDDEPVMRKVGGKPRAYICRVCGTFYGNRRGAYYWCMQLHSVNNNTKYKCEICLKVLRDLQRRHRCPGAPPEDTYPFRCSFCGKEFPRRFNKQRHEKQGCDKKP